MKFNLSSLNTQNIKKGLNYIKYNGLSGVWSRVRYKMSGPGLGYNNWYRENHEADEEELSKQRQTKFDYEPVISILVPIYMTPEFFLRAMIDSVRRQTYKKWQLCIVDGSDVNDRNQESEPSGKDQVYSLETEKIIRQYMEEDERIEYMMLKENLGISENTNKALTMAGGDYILLLDHDDIISDDALFCVVDALQEERYDAIYSDEDKMSEDGTKVSDPAFKPDFSIDLLRAHNYITHLFVVKRELALAVGGFRSEYDGAQDYDFILRCCENTESIKHIPRVLYHWRINNNSVSANAHKKEYALEAGKKALSAHLTRRGGYAKVSHTDMWGIYKVTYETPGNPFISIIIPGGDDETMLDKCLVSLFEKARYNNFEIIIVDYDGENEKMLSYYHRIEKMRKNIRIVTYKDAKGINDARNYGASAAKGDYLLFLDNNTEIIDVTAIGEMLGICMRKEVGAVAGTLYTDNNSICHEGIAIGLNGLYSYLYQGIKRGGFGYLMHNRVNGNYSAVSAACFMIKTDLFDKLDGFADKFRTELSEIDFCLRIRELNKLVVCAADAGWYYHKMPKASDLVSPENRQIKENAEEVLMQEENLFQILWSNILKEGDPYYNSNFTREGEPFTLKKL